MLTVAVAAFSVDAPWDMTHDILYFNDDETHWKDMFAMAEFGCHMKDIPIEKDRIWLAKLSNHYYEAVDELASQDFVLNIVWSYD